VQDMEKSVETIVHLACIWEEKANLKIWKFANVQMEYICSRPAACRYKKPPDIIPMTFFIQNSGTGLLFNYRFTKHICTISEYNVV
jgi:hypothetical protein